MFTCTFPATEPMKHLYYKSVYACTHISKQTHAVIVLHTRICKYEFNIGHAQVESKWQLLCVVHDLESLSYPTTCYILSIIKLNNNVYMSIVNKMNIACLYIEHVHTCKQYNYSLHVLCENGVPITEIHTVSSFLLKALLPPLSLDVAVIPAGRTWTLRKKLLSFW